MPEAHLPGTIFVIDASGQTQPVLKVQSTPLNLYQTNPITLTNSEIINSKFETAVQLAASPGQGLMIVPWMAILSCDTSGGAYGNVNGSFKFSLGVAAMNEADPANTSNLLTSGDPETWVIPSLIDPAISENFTTQFDNKPLLFYLDNSGILSGGGNSNNLVVTAFYALASLT